MTISEFGFQIYTLTNQLESYVLPLDKPSIIHHLEDPLLEDPLYPKRKRLIEAVTVEGLEGKLNGLKEHLITNWEATKSFEGDEVTLLYRLRRTLEASIMIANYTLRDSVMKLKDIRGLQKIKQTNIDLLKWLKPLTLMKVIDQETALMTTLPPVLCDLIADYSEDQTFAHAMISAGYQEMTIEATRRIGYEKTRCGYDLLSRLVCRQNRPLHFSRICAWDLYQLAKRPEALQRMDLNQYARAPKSLLKIISLLEWADQIQPSYKLVASTLKRTYTPLNLECFPPSFLAKHASYIQNILLDSSRKVFLEFTRSVPSDILTHILARNLRPTNVKPKLLSSKPLITKELQQFINWKILIDNLNDNSCLSLYNDSDLAIRIFKELETQDPLKGRQRALTILANSLVYDSWKDAYKMHDIRKFGFSDEELWPILFKQLKKVVDLDEQTYSESIDNVLDLIREINFRKYPNTGDSIEDLMQHLANHLKDHSFLCFRGVLGHGSFRILNLMPNDDRRRKIIINSIAKYPYAVRDLTEYNQHFEVPETQIHEGLRNVLLNNLTQFNSSSTLVDSNEFAFREIESYPYRYLNREHIQLFLNQLTPEFGFSWHFPQISVKIINEMDLNNPLHRQILNNTWYRAFKLYLKKVNEIQTQKIDYIGTIIGMTSPILSILKAVSKVFHRSVPPQHWIIDISEGHL